MRKFMMVMFLSAVAAAPAAYASPGFDFGANIARTTTSGYRNSSDFGLTAGYDFNRSMGVEGGYESLMGYEMTLLSVSALDRYRISDHIHLLGLLGMSYWTESPTGKYKASGIDPLLGLGLSYRLTKAVSIRAEYQFVPHFNGLGTNLNTFLLGVNFRF
ncbi:MAG: outer membrane beta-barrel protein [Metallibacterium scheffleri]|jgi:hypothetical protein